jgi:hypothetical protein
MHPVDEPTRHRYPGAPFETPSVQFSRAPKRKSNAGPIAAVVVGVLALIGVGVYAGLAFGSKPATPTAQPTTTATAAAQPKPATSTAPAPKPGAGQEVVQSAGLKVTAFAWRTPVAKKEAKPSEFDFPDNYVWAALDVQVCLPANAPDDWTVGSWAWTVRYADNTTAEPADITGMTGWPKPQYPLIDRKIPGGSCIRGWITFAAPAGAKPAVAVYAPSDGSPVEWIM